MFSSQQSNRKGTPMKRAIAAALMLLAVGTASGQHSLPRAFTDVPRGHWAYRTYATLVRAGVATSLDVRSCWSKRLIEATRYEFAVAVDWSSRKIASLAASSKPEDRRKVTPEVRRALSRLRTEFAAEIRMAAKAVPKAPKKPSGT